MLRKEYCRAPALPVAGRIPIHMSIRAKIYIAGVICTGLTGLLISLINWQSSETLRFLAYFAASLISSGMKVSLPGIKGTMSVNFFFILLGIAELTWSETLLMTAVCFTLQYAWHAKEKRQPIKLLFNLGNASASITAAYFLYKLPVFYSLGIQQSFLLTIVSCEIGRAHV